MTTMEIAAEHGVSRQTIHTYRRTGVFPQPVEGEGSTRPRFRADEVAAFFAANPKQPGVKRTPPKQQGERMKIDRLRIDGEPVRRFFVIAEVTFADREAEPRDEYDHNYYQDSELRSVATDWMQDGLTDRDDSPAVRFREVPEEWRERLAPEPSDG